MRNLAPLLTPDQTAKILDISVPTLNALVYNGIIPHTYVQDQDAQELRFDLYIITEWLQTNPRIALQEDTDDYIKILSNRYKTAYPKTMQSLKTFDSNFAVRRKAKGYNLVKVPNKKHGFLYYVRYIDNGKLVYSRWNTYTNDHTAAQQFAVENREKILAKYHADRQPQGSPKGLYHTLKTYYKADSPYLNDDRKRGRMIAPRTAHMFDSWICKVFVPFLRSNKVSTFDGITPPLIAKLQTKLLSKGIKAQTINQQISGINLIYKHLIMNGTLTENPIDRVSSLKKQPDLNPRGCYETDKTSGVFNTRWPDELSYLLCLIIYTTGMRNSEIEKMRLSDIIAIKDCRFINIPVSKTESGIRIAPLHLFVYEKILTYAKKYKISPNKCIFPVNDSRVYARANVLMCQRLSKNLGIKPENAEQYLEKQNISFYSGRHFWKTLMNANELGDVEEYFMGHKVSSDVAKRYNHRDKQGQELLLKKTRKVFTILDRWVFKT